MNRFFSTLLTITVGVFLVTFVIRAQTVGNASLSLIEDLQSDLFTLTFSDPEGVASFALEFKTGKLPYSGDLSGCQRSRTINNIAALNDNDLAETIVGRIIDCRGGETEFEISKVDAKGRAQVKKLGVEPEPAPLTPSPTPTTQTKTTAPEPKPTPASEVSEITYPVPELGNCENKEKCFAYCELPGNGKQCLEFAKKHQLLPEEEIRVAEKVLGVKGGPGGCNSKASCENYCNDVSKIDECIVFAEENGLMKGKELEEAKKVRTAIQDGKKLPGDCRNKTACENYCKNSEHIDECLAFAESTGFLSPEELEQARKFMPLIKSGETPGACKSKDECEAYCDADGNFEECISFAEKHGMIPEEEREHIEAFKKAGGRGPGGCKGRQCQAFCEQPDNQESCFLWAKDNGILKEEDLRRMGEGQKQIEKVFNDAPPEVASCIEEALGPGGLERMRSGGFFGGETVGEKIRACFEGFMSQMGGSFGGPDGEHGMPGGFSGPGGCKGPDECMSYCKEHPEECQNFGPQGKESEHKEFPNNDSGGFGGPGGCKSKEECQRFCEENPEKCSEFTTQKGFPTQPPTTESEGTLYGKPYSGKTYPADFEGKCDPGWNLELNPTTNSKYCAITQEKCSELHTGTTLTKDNLGYAICWLSTGNPLNNGVPQPHQEELQKIQEQYNQQYQQQYQQEFQKQHEDQYRQQYEQQYQQQYQQQHQQQYQQTQPPPTSSITNPFALILAPFVNLFR